MSGIEIRVKGKVQGVGFRPFVWQLAHRLSLQGEVLNDGQGVLIRLYIKEISALQQFEQGLKDELPPLARIDSIHTCDTEWKTPPTHFSIIESQVTSIDTQVVPDAATCPECLKELLTLECEQESEDGHSHDRRFNYPFINCTHCGPRFTIIKGLPYDRPKTVMADFPMCHACNEEYANPADRRYHAQPVACPHCGPVVSVALPDGTRLEGDWFTHAINALNEGKIIAIKSVGGFHLACDATNSQAVQTLRNRKQRQFKPFAVMVSNLESISKLAHLSDSEAQHLQSSAAPIVLLRCKEHSEIAKEIAPELNEIGIMLPSNPVQHMIAHYFAKPVVMTSGNRTGLPPTLDNQTALNELNTIADLFLLHNREIVQRCDDSLIRVNNDGQQETLRRSRGYAPDALDLPEGFPNADGFIATGGDLKSAFAIGKGNQIIVSQYLGDLANIESQQQYRNAINHFIELYDLSPRNWVTDLHSGYYSHQYAHSKAKNPIEIQHHHAHIASCLVENQWPAHGGKVLALALDGLGLGNDGTLWGAELMLADYKECHHLGGIPAISLVGGDKAAKEPWRAYYAHLKAFTSPEWLNKVKQGMLFEEKPVALLDVATEKGINCHQVRSAGRLFDAVAASLNICFDKIEYEGQAACQLEALANRYPNKSSLLPIPIRQQELELGMSDFWMSFLQYEGSNEEKAYLFHLTLAEALAELVLSAQSRVSSVTHLVLTGGVFHNALLTQLIKERLKNKITILQHQQFSCGDGGLALGQLAIALIQQNNSVGKVNAHSDK